MKAEVPMSNTTGPSADGRPKAIGLVPSAGAIAPGGAVERTELAVCSPTRSALAIISM